MQILVSPALRFAFVWLLGFGDTGEEMAAHFVTFVEEQNADFRENIWMVIAKWQRWKLSTVWKISLVVSAPSLSI